MIDVEFAKCAPMLNSIRDGYSCRRNLLWTVHIDRLHGLFDVFFDLFDPLFLQNNLCLRGSFDPIMIIQLCG